MMKVTILTTFFLLIWFILPAQSDDDPPPFDCYQVYFEEPVSSVVKVEYSDSKEPVKFRINEDGTKLILEDYKGKKRIDYTVKTKSGEEKKYTKSSCFIDPCEINI